MSFEDHEVYSLYAGMWAEARPAIAANEVAVDEHLNDRANDYRRGMTVVARLSEEVRERIAACLEPLRELEPRLYYPRPEEYHITVLSLFTATEAFEPFFARQEAYRQAVHEALPGTVPFRVTFHGLTASRGVIMAQGYTDDDTLNDLRDRLRGSLTRAGLAAGLDTRYRMRAAHTSLVRFPTRLTAPDRLCAFLDAHRETDFGTVTVDRLQLIDNDWYAAHDRVKMIETFAIGK